MDRDHKQCRFGGEWGTSPATGKLVEMRCSCECWPSLASVSCSNFRRGGYLQEGLFCMERAAQGEGKALAIVASQGRDGH